MRRAQLYKLATALCLALLSACGGGGGGSSSGGGGTARATVTGSVLLAPANQLSTTTAASVPDGTLVWLARIGTSGQVEEVLLQTQTTDTRYSFDLSSRGLSYASNLIVGVGQSGGEVARGFAAGPIVDISASSEAAVKLLLSKLQEAGGSLSNVSAREASDYQIFVDAVFQGHTSAKAQDLQSATTAASLLASGDADLTAFLESVVEPGESSINVGDIGNYFPLKSKSVYSYVLTQAAPSLPTQPPARFVQEPSIVSGLTAYPVENESGSVEYIAKDRAGARLVWPNSQSQSSLPNPFTFLYFPLRVGDSRVLHESTVQVEDLDGDFRPESMTVRVEYQVVSRETVRLPTRDLRSCMKVLTTSRKNIILSRTNELAVDVVEETAWYAPGIGEVRSNIKLTSTFRGKTQTETAAAELASVAFVDEIDAIAHDIAFDPTTERLYATLAGTSLGDPSRIAVIDQVAVRIGASLSVDGDARRLSLSRDGKLLYVGLLRAGASVSQGYVQKYQATNLALQKEFSFGSAPSFDTAFDIDVSPFDPDVLFIQRYQGTSESSGLFISGRKTSGARLLAGEAEFSDDGKVYVLDGGGGLTVTQLFKPGLIGTSVDVLDRISPNYAFGKNALRIRTGRAFLGTGKVVNLADGRVTTLNLPLSSGPAGPFEPSSDGSRVFAIRGGKLDVFDAATGTASEGTLNLGKVGVLDASPSALPPTRLVRFGRDGLAIATPSKIALVHTPLWLDSVAALSPISGGYAGELIAVPVDGMPWSIQCNSVRNKVYASIQGTRNRLMVIDATSGAVTDVPLTSGPSDLTISADGKFAYTSLRGERLVQRIDLDSATPSLRIPSWTDARCPGSAVTPESLAVAPNNSRAIAVLGTTACAPPSIAVYDDAVMRPTNASSANFINRLAFGASESILFAGALGFGDLSQFSIDANGIQRAIALPNPDLGSLQFFENKLLGSTGKILDLSNLSIRRFEMPNYLVGGLDGGRVDSVSRRALFVGSTFLREFDWDSGQYLSSVGFPEDLQPGLSFGGETHIGLCGASSIAFQTAFSPTKIIVYKPTR